MLSQRLSSHVMLSKYKISTGGKVMIEKVGRAMKPFFAMLCIVAVVYITEHHGGNGMCISVGIAALAGLGGYTLREAITTLRGDK